MAFDNDDAVYYYLFELQGEFLAKDIQAMQDHRNDSSYRQQWRVIPAKMLIKEWQYNQKTGLTHEKVIEKIEKIVIENYLKIYINTVLGGHTSQRIFEFAESYLPEDMTEEEFEKLLEDTEDYICDDNGTWRLSDYGLSEIEKYVIQLLTTDDSNKKLFLIDCILNVVHQRNDLSSWFIEGGRDTLRTLSGEVIGANL